MGAAYAIKSKQEPGPQATPPESGAETIDKGLMMKLIDPLMRYLSKTAIKSTSDPSKICTAMSEELNRLLTQEHGELKTITGGLYEHGTEEHMDDDNFNGARLS